MYTFKIWVEHRLTNFWLFLAEHAIDNKTYVKCMETANEHLNYQRTLIEKKYGMKLEDL